MKKAFSLLLLACTPLLVAPSASAREPSSDKSGQATIRGCLQRSDGQYILIDKENTYRRLSSNGKLKHLVGHEIEVTGKPQTMTIDTTPAGAASSTTQQSYFEIKTIKDVTPNCAEYGR